MRYIPVRRRKLNTPDLIPPGGPYLALSLAADLEIFVRIFADKNHQPCSRLRIARMVGEF